MPGNEINKVNLVGGLRQSSYYKLETVDSGSPCSFQNVSRGRKTLLVLLAPSLNSFPACTSGDTEISRKTGAQTLGGV